MNRPLRSLAGFVLLLLLVAPVPGALALEEPDRLWLVGERSFADGLYPLARRALERFVAQYPRDPRFADALFMLGKARLAAGDAAGALDAFRRAQTLQPVPGQPLEAKFWEAEALFRLRRFSEARTAYDEVVRRDAASPRAPDALYGLGWTELELQRPEPAVTAFRDFLTTWPQHPLASSAAFYQARALVELKRFDEAVPLLTDFAAKYPDAKLVADARYLLGVARVSSGDAREGVAELRSFVAAYPGHGSAPAARRLITETLARGGDRDALQEMYKTLMEQAPATPESLTDAASIAGRLNRPKDQEVAWRKLRSQFPDHRLGRRASLELANAAFRRKEWKDASTLAQAAAQTDEDAVRAEALLLVGESELKLRRFAPAVKAFEGVAAIADAEASLRYRALAGVGLVREEQQDWRAALTAYESVASQADDPTLRDWARERASAVKSRIAEKPRSSEKVEKKPAPTKKKVNRR
jgi:TolA-binding protein